MLILKLVFLLLLLFPSLVFSAQGYKTRFNSFTGKQDYIIDTSNIEAGSITATGTVTGVVVCLEGGTFDTYLIAGTPTSSEYYYWPLTDGTANQVLSTNGSGVLSWAAGGSVSDTAYGAGWNGDATTAPSKNAVYDKIETLAPLASPTFTGTVTIPTPFTLGAVSVLPTGTELNYVDGVTSAIQTQIDSKQGTLTNSAGLAAALSDETGTGAAVFGTSPTVSLGANSTVQSGANPTTDAAGEVGVDTSATSGAGFRFYADAAYHLPGYLSKSFVITSPTAAADAAIWRVPYAITIRAIHGVQVGGTNVIGMLTECDANGLNPVVVDSSDMTITTSNVNDDGSLSNPSIDSGDYIGWATTSVSGTITRATITFEYTVDLVS